MFLINHNSPLLRQNRVYCADRILMDLNVDQVDWFHDSRFCVENGSTDTSSEQDLILV